jgi:hypothetical protein
MKVTTVKTSEIRERIEKLSSYEFDALYKKIEAGKFFSQSKPKSIAQERRQEMRGERRHCKRYEY